MKKYYPSFLTVPAFILLLSFCHTAQAHKAPLDLEIPQIKTKRPNNNNSKKDSNANNNSSSNRDYSNNNDNGVETKSSRQLTTPSIAPTITNSSTLPIKIINQQQIQARSNNNAQSLAQVFTDGVGSGLQTTDLFGDGSTISLNMRGFGDNAISNTLVLLDGEPIVNPDTSPLKLNTISITEVEQIEIMPGSAGVLYGDQAIGGVINIITKRPKAQESGANISYGSFNTRQFQGLFGNLLHDKNNHSLGLRISALHYDTNNYRQNNYNQNNNFNLVLNHQTSTSNVDFIYRKNNQHLQLPGSLTWQQVQDNPRQADKNNAFSNEDGDFWQLNIKKYLNESWLASASGTIRQIDGIGAFGPATFNDERRANTLHLKVDGIMPIGNSSVRSTLGGSVEKSSYGLNLNNIASGKNRSYKNENTVYGQLNVLLTPSWTAIAGARFAEARYTIDPGFGQPQFEPNNRATATNLELSWRANGNFRYYIRRADSFRFPKVDEENFTLNKVPLKTQTGTSYEGGIIFNHYRAKLTLSVYQLDINNELIAIPVATAAYNVVNTNLDPTKRLGAILDTSFKITQRWTLDANYNLVDAKFKSGPNQGKQMPFVAQHSANLTTTYTFDNHWYLSLGNNFTGQRYPLSDVENRSAPLGGFTVHNLTIGYNQPHYNISLRINNLTNKFYYGYVVSSYNGQAVNNAYYPIAGINALLNLSVNL